MDNVKKSSDIIKNTAINFESQIAVMMGSGLGAVADLLEEQASISYKDLPGFPEPTIAGHDGRLSIGNVGSTNVYFLKGRQHLYEGHGTDGIKTMLRTLKTLGVNVLILTNASGSIKEEYPPGSIVALTDHINLTGMNPLVGPNDEQWGSRFPDMHNAWDEDLRNTLLDIAKHKNIPLGQGVYACFLGPTFETPAEVNFARTIGADLVGMSTVPECIVARHCGIKCLGVSAITNLAAGLSDVELSHEQTLEGASLAEKKLANLLAAYLMNFDS